MEYLQTQHTCKTPGALRCAFRQRGTSLLEGIAYLGIAALIILGAIALLSNAFGNANSNRTHTELSSIKTGIRKLFMGSASSYGTASLLPELIAAKAFPATMQISGNNVYNAWGGSVTVTGNTSTFTVSYGSVPKDICVNLATAVGDWTSLTVNGSSLTVPATPSAATTACTSATANTLAWSST